MFSAAIELGMPSHPLITAPPRFQIDLTLLFLTVSAFYVGIRTSFDPAEACGQRYDAA
jgi:hypothetical protein